MASAIRQPWGEAELREHGAGGMRPKFSTRYLRRRPMATASSRTARWPATGSRLLPGPTPGAPCDPDPQRASPPPSTRAKALHLIAPVTVARHEATRKAMKGPLPSGGPDAANRQDGCKSWPMITLCRAEERRHMRRDHGAFRLTIFPQERRGQLVDGFGAIELLNEGHLPRSARVPLRPRHGVEIVTYVREGALAHRDWMGRSGIIHAGEFQQKDRRERHSPQRNERLRDRADACLPDLAAPYGGSVPSTRAQPRAEALQRGGPPSPAVRRRVP